MSEIPSITYKGVLIEYNEQKDRWDFTCEGISRRADTLSNAKASIDNPPPPKDSKPFKRVQCYCSTRYREWEVVTVTSLIAGEFPDKAAPSEAWVNTPDGRRKEYLTNLFPVCPLNDALMAEITRTKEAIDRLEKESTKYVKKLKHLKP